MTIIKKDFKWKDVNLGDELIVIDNNECESFMAIQDGTGDWYDIMFLSREGLEYMPAGLSFNSHENCIKHMYKDSKEIEVRLSRKKDKDLAIEYAYDRGFKSTRTITLDEIEAILECKVELA